jgi:nicotinate-nucleotide adenylyltransferase
MTSGTRIGILGGTFDPVHLGHVETALAAARALELDRVLVLPAGTPPHRHQQPIASRFHRFAMTALAITGVPPLAVSDLEIGQSGPSYTFETLARVQATGVAASQIFFITGADAFAEIETWSRYPRVLDMAHFVVVSRPSHPTSALRSMLPTLASRMTTSDIAQHTSPQPQIILVDASTPDVSSTGIRRLLETGGSIAGLVPAPVATYIDQHGLYTRVGASQRPADHLHG